jgi:hypothetical protein
MMAGLPRPPSLLNDLENNGTTAVFGADAVGNAEGFA